MLFLNSCKEQEKTALEKLRGMYKLDRFEIKDSLTNKWIASLSGKDIADIFYMMGWDMWLFT
jgi:hypothetical protein